MGEMDIRRIEDFIKTLEERELIYINQLVIDRLNLLSQMRSSETMSKFHVRQRVSFTTPDGRHKKGVITRLHKKTVSITTDDGESWNVGPGLLRGE